MYNALLLVQLYREDKKQRGCDQESQDKADMPDSCPVKTERSSWEPTHDLNNLIKWVCSFLFFQRELLWRHFKNTASTLFWFFLSSPECDSILPLLVGSRYMLYSIIAQSNLPLLCGVRLPMSPVVFNFKRLHMTFSKGEKEQNGIHWKENYMYPSKWTWHKLEYYAF